MRRLAIIDQTVTAGGVERFLQGLLEGLLTLPEIADWDITLVLARNNSAGVPVEWPKRFIKRNIRVRYLHDDGLSRLVKRLKRTGNLWGMPGTWRIPRLIQRGIRIWDEERYTAHRGHPRLWIEDFVRQNRVDVVYFSWPYEMDCPALAAPMVATVHDFHFKRRLTLSPDGCMEFERRMPVWLRRCRKVIVSTQFIAEEMQGYYPEFSLKTELVYPGTPGRRVTFEPAAVRTCLGRIGLSRPFLLTVGWIVRHKNQKVVFEALSLLRKRGVDISLVCAGPNTHWMRPENRHRANPYLRQVLEAAGQLGLEYGRDFFGVGYVPDEELELLYRSARGVIISSLYEAGSFPLTEAFRAGCPVICSRIAPLINQVHLIGGQAWFFEPSDAEALAEVLVREVLSHPEAARKKAGRASEFVERSLTWHNMARQYLRIFEEAQACQN